MLLESLVCVSWILAIEQLLGKIFRRLCCRDRQGIPGEPYRLSALGFDWLHGLGQRKSSTVSGCPHVQFHSRYRLRIIANTTHSRQLMSNINIVTFKVLDNLSTCTLQTAWA